MGHSRTRADRAKRKLCHQIPDVAPGTGLVLWGQAAPPGADSPAPWRALEAAGGLSQAEDQVPQGAGGDGLHSWGPTQPPVHQPWRNDKGAGEPERESHTNHLETLQPPGPRPLPKLGTEMDQAAAQHTPSDKTPTQTETDTKATLTLSAAACQALGGHFMTYYLICTPQQPRQVGILLP